MGFPSGSAGKNPLQCRRRGNTGSILGSKIFPEKKKNIFPGGGDGNPLQ